MGGPWEGTRGAKSGVIIREGGRPHILCILFNQEPVYMGKSDGGLYVNSVQCGINAVSLFVV